MEKILLTCEIDVKKVVSEFGNEWEQAIREEINEYPCILVSSWADDIEFGETWSFNTVILKDFYELLN
ncbi:hypothetical protein N9672_01840 [Flavobacteriaceae bacterium]|mgnify:FL=1|nr:hypothetical protein [Flavobacteriaceae bacterium]MDB4183076.1 hypothetical protein [Flavobacteriaceae bacterium]MDC0629468.1 hypothetical protein [Flavobacteriaceae bacterium]|tara:strand:+ start:2759 stop:2962 length:204 start_codon:yes stop_codon:yes gene_type:complete